jgi:hypothetical protein
MQNKIKFVRIKTLLHVRASGLSGLIGWDEDLLQLSYPNFNKIWIAYRVKVVGLICFKHLKFCGGQVYPKTSLLDYSNFNEIHNLIIGDPNPIRQAYMILFDKNCWGRFNCDWSLSLPLVHQQLLQQAKKKKKAHQGK